MSSYNIDVEKAAGFKAFEAQSGNVSIAPNSPKDSQAETLVEDESATTDEKTSECEETRVSIWSRGIGALRRCLEPSSWFKSKHTGEYKLESIVKKIHDQPVGYPRLATFLDSDENFMIYRRFGYLQSRLLLERQDELRMLEMKLETMDSKDSATSPDALKNRLDMSKERKALFERIELKWSAYCQLLSAASTMTAMNKPTSVEQHSVWNWMRNIKPVRSAEANFVRCSEDLVILRPGREHAWLDSGVEKMLRWLQWKPIRQAFQSQDTREKYDSEDGTVLYTRSRIDNFVVSIITVMVLALLVVPIYVLYKLSEGGDITSKRSFECVGVLLVSTLAFSACISLFTRAKRHETLAASAGYCAVLVVFIGNIGQHGP